MAPPKPAEHDLFEKIRSLPPDRVAEVEDFVDFLRVREEELRLTDAATKSSEPAFRRVWDNPADADYDRLHSTTEPRLASTR